MSDPHCPGQDMRYWKPEDIFDVECPFCRFLIEFWKDESMRVCPQCKGEVLNPRINWECTSWCKSAGACVGKAVRKQEDR